VILSAKFAQVPPMSRAILAIDRIVTNAVWLLAAALLAVVSCLGLYQVLVRFVFNQPSPWTEELIGRLLIWTVMLGVAAAFRQGALVSVDVPLRLARGGLRRAVRLAILAGSLDARAARSRLSLKARPRRRASAVCRT
jgi:TRAP-type C4-dicarboxylate transport system permease small subunit